MKKKYTLTTRILNKIKNIILKTKEYRNYQKHELYLNIEIMF